MTLTKKKSLFFAVIVLTATITWNINQERKNKLGIPDTLSGSQISENTNLDEQSEPPPSVESDVKTSATIVDQSAEADLKKITLLKNLNHSIADMSSCLSLSEPGPISANENSVLGFLDTLKTDLGEAVYQNLQWSNTSVRLPNGDQRRIRIETENNDEMSTQSIKLFSLDQEGYPVLIPLSPEQTKNPTQTFIASLENSGEIIKQEKAERLIFQNGEDLHLVQLNGQLKEFEISRNSKSFKCEGLVDSQPNCVCL